MSHAGQKIDDAEWAQIQARAAQFRRNGTAPHKVHVFSYRRCSHADSRDSRLGLEAQRERMEAYIDLLKTKTDVVVGIMFSDEAVSAYRRRLITRPEGKRLNKSLRPGDHVVFPRLDRAFRDMYDLVDTIRMWEERKITVHFVEEGLDLSSPFGRAMMHIIGAIAQLHSEYTSARNKESAARMKAQGRPAGGKAPPGFKWAGKKGKRHLVPDPEQRRIMREIVHLRDSLGWSWAQISDHLEDTLAERESRRAVPRWAKRKWSHSRCRLAYQAEKRLEMEAPKSSDE